VSSDTDSALAAPRRLRSGVDVARRDRRAAAAGGSCSAPKIQVQTPFSQPQKPPADADELVALGDADGLLVHVGPGLAAWSRRTRTGTPRRWRLAVPAFVDGELLRRPSGSLWRTAWAEDEPLSDDVVVAPQTAVANGSAVEEPAALAGVARASVPRPPRRRAGTETAAFARRVDALERTCSVLRVLVGTGLLHFRKVARRGFGGFVLELFVRCRLGDLERPLAARRRLPARPWDPGGRQGAAGSGRAGCR